MITRDDIEAMADVAFLKWWSEANSEVSGEHSTRHVLFFLDILDEIKNNYLEHAKNTIDKQVRDAFMAGVKFAEKNL
jgi:hypothetical protein